MLVGFFLITLYTVPRAQVANHLVAATVITFAALYAVFVHFVLNWQSIRREGQVHLMAAFLVCTDILFISVFVWAMGAPFLNLALLLLLDVVFAAAFFSGLELPLVTGVVCGAYIALNIALGRPMVAWHATAGVVGAIVVVAWLAYATAEVARRERATTDRIVRYLTEGVMLVTREGELAVVNPRIEHMLGINASNVVGLNIHDPRNATALEHLADILADVPKGAVYDPEIAMRQLHIENPTPVDIQSLTVPCVTDDSQLVAWVVVCKDITDVLSTVRVKEEGIAVLSHELRGRLHSVRASSEVLIRMADHLSPEVRAETLRLLDTETRRLSHLIGRTLETTAIEDKTARFEFEAVALEELIGEVCKRFRDAAAKKELALLFECAGDIPAVRGDSTRLDQVVHNLLENAIKFTPPNGQVRLEVVGENGHARVTVADTGVGIPAERREAIFEKFAHGETGTPAYVDGGLGLGLYICREIVHRHGGEIGVDSVEGRGATFYFTVPSFTDEPEHAGSLARAQA